MSEHIEQHLNADEIELWALGLLPAVRALHLAQCAACLTSAEAERKLYRELVQLERFAPSVGFADRVLARIQMPVRTV